MAANANTDLSNPQISVSFLRTYSALNELDNKQLKKIVERLRDEDMIMTKSSLDNVKRKTLETKNYPTVVLDALKPEEGEPLSCS